MFGTIESVKAVSELYRAGDRRSHRGQRGARRRQPETVNTEPHEAWMIVLKVDQTPATRRTLLDADGLHAT